MAKVLARRVEAGAVGALFWAAGEVHACMNDTRLSDVLQGIFPSKPRTHPRGSTAKILLHIAQMLPHGIFPLGLAVLPNPSIAEEWIPAPAYLPVDSFVSRLHILPAHLSYLALP